jgi:hypothetical protein
VAKRWLLVGLLRGGTRLSARCAFRIHNPIIP